MTWRWSDNRQWIPKGQRPCLLLTLSSHEIQLNANTRSKFGLTWGLSLCNLLGLWGLTVDKDYNRRTLSKTLWEKLREGPSEPTVAKGFAVLISQKWSTIDWMAMMHLSKSVWNALPQSSSGLTNVNKKFALLISCASHSLILKSPYGAKKEPCLETFPITMHEPRALLSLCTKLKKGPTHPVCRRQVAGPCHVGVPCQILLADTIWIRALERHQMMKGFLDFYWSLLTAVGFVNESEGHGLGQKDADFSLK